MDEIQPPPPPGPAPATAGADAGELLRLQPRTIAYWYVMDLIGALILGGLVVAGWWFLRDHAGPWSAVATWAAAVLVGLLLVQTVFGPPLAFACWRYAFAGDLLHMRYGILWREERAVPVRRMQHVDLMRGPVERLFGLATLVVHTAGNEGSAFRVPGLLPAQAQALRDRILRARGDDVV